MSISFMVLGGPRCGTTWAANWLTTESTICLHDPLLEYKLPMLEQMQFPGRKLGISCTSAMLYPNWVNSLKCPKVILFRELDEINHSLRQLGLAELDRAKHIARLEAIKDALLIPYNLLFSPLSAAGIAKHLGLPFDAARYDLLRQMRVEPMWQHLNVGKEAVKALTQRILEAR